MPKGYNEMKRSSFNPNFWGCPFCDWPLQPDQHEKDNGGMTCACGKWIVLPEPPIPPKEAREKE
jgi:hypothetical protein